MGYKEKLKRFPVIKQYNEKFESLYIRLNNMENTLKSIERMQLNAYMDIMQNKFETGGFIREAIYNLRNVTSVMDADVPYIRIGRDNDGGYVMANRFSGSKIAYSLGICDDVSWDKEMADRRLDVFMYDHTIDSLPENNDRFHFFKTGISDKDEGNLKSLDTLIRENGHEKENNIILKMDIEGCEWDVLNNTNTLSHFSQIVIELHGLCDLNNTKILPALLKLRETHVPVHVHANNCSPVQFYGDCMLPDALEVTYLKKTDFEFKESNRFFPTRWDMVNDKSKPEIILGMWKENQNV